MNRYLSDSRLCRHSRLQASLWSNSNLGARTTSQRLRAVATDADPELRQRVLGLLAREKDGFAEKRLLEGLQQPEKALVPPEKALQLLSYDIHAEAYPVARMIVKNPPNEEAKREALRLLAADASSKPLFERILNDKEETKENRQLSASALQAIAPDSDADTCARIVARSKGVR